VIVAVTGSDEGILASINQSLLIPRVYTRRILVGCRLIDVWLGFSLLMMLLITKKHRTSATTTTSTANVNTQGK